MMRSRHLKKRRYRRYLRNMRARNRRNEAFSFEDWVLQKYGPNEPAATQEQGSQLEPEPGGAVLQVEEDA